MDSEWIDEWIVSLQLWEMQNSLTVQQALEPESITTFIYSGRTGNIDTCLTKENKQTNKQTIALFS